MSAVEWTMEGVLWTGGCVLGTMLLGGMFTVGGIMWLASVW